MNTPEILRGYIDKAVRFGRSKQSKQTGFIHHFHGKKEEPVALTIPMVENTLFALSLLRSRTADNVTEGKQMIDRLLYFQHENFPTYMHQYPSCDDLKVGLHLLTPLYWIFHSFHPVLGARLRKRLQESMSSLLIYSLGVQQKQKLPYHLEVTVAAAAKAYGKEFKNEDWEQKGESCLEALSEREEPASWGIPSQLGLTLAALQMACPNISHWKLLWKYLCQTWHRGTASYGGPLIAGFQEGTNPELTLYDFYLCYLTQELSPRLEGESFNCLQAVLVQPCEDRVLSSTSSYSLEGSIAQSHWRAEFNKTYAWVAMENAEPVKPGKHPWRLVWGTPDNVETLTCQGGNSETLQWDNGDLLFSLKEPSSDDNPTKNRDLTFYLSKDPCMRIRVGSEPATTFQLGDEVQIENNALQVNLSFHLDDGNGQFFGHIMPGNRPSQRNADPFEASDWQILLRTVSRTAPCKIRVKVQLTETYRK